MASTESSGPVNGNYAPQAYENSYSTGASNFTPSQQPTATQPAQQAAASEIPKDEVGWYFVEQYYTTLSKSPDRLYLFYNKRSQYVSGVEEDKVNVCLGQKAINERIKELDFKDTKVRVTNVDSQGSDANIVIQVIGEISNQGQPHKRFVQTFVLAEQTNGYFVLNDIFRYLAEEPEEDEDQQEQSAPANGITEPAPTAAVPDTAELNKSDEIATSEEDLNKVDNKLQEAVKEEPAVEEVAPAAPAQQVPDEVEQPAAEEAPTSVEEKAAEEPQAPAEETTGPEKPTAPAASAQKAAPVAMPSGPPKPSAPRTWASLAASAHKVATPVVNAPASQQAASQPKAAAAAAAAPAQSTAAAPAQTAAPAREQSPATSQGEAAGWQSVTGHKKEQSRAQNAGPAADPDQKRAYIKNVYSQVEEGALRAALTKFGEIEYLDISRGKNCAFVDFKTPAGFQGAVAANPHTVNGVEMKVEERRQNPAQFNRGGFARGGAPRGRGGMGGQAPRGNFTPRGRGGPMRGGRGGAPQES
ncbi:NTF2 and RRM domain containing protein [Stemphylium lycopersici]|nr:NTF2 and RRM domain containing protein [Stemphylium lycopersici]